MEYSWNILTIFQNQAYARNIPGIYVHTQKACIALVSSLGCIKDVVNIGVKKLSCKKEFVSGSYRYDNLSVEYA